MPRHVVFDFDGTLVDSLGLFVSAYNTIAQKRGFKLMTAERIAEMRRLSPRARVSYLNVRWYNLPGLARELKQVYRNEMARLQTFPGIPEVLATLQGRGIGCGVVSSNTADNIRDFAAQAGLPAFSDVRSAGLFGKHRVLARYLRAHRLSPGEVLYVGDEVRDTEACRKVGLRMIAVTWGADRRESFERCPPEGFADTPDALLALIDRF